jgi:hypothetical protein
MHGAQEKAVGHLVAPPSMKSMRKIGGDGAVFLPEVRISGVARTMPELTGWAGLVERQSSPTSASTGNSTGFYERHVRIDEDAGPVHLGLPGDRGPHLVQADGLRLVSIFS